MHPVLLCILKTYQYPPRFNVFNGQADSQFGLAYILGHSKPLKNNPQLTSKENMGLVVTLEISGATFFNPHKPGYSSEEICYRFYSISKC